MAPYSDIFSPYRDLICGGTPSGYRTCYGAKFLHRMGRWEKAVYTCGAREMESCVNVQHVTYIGSGDAKWQRLQPFWKRFETGKKRFENGLKTVWKFENVLEPFPRKRFENGCNRFGTVFKTFFCVFCEIVKLNWIFNVFSHNSFQILTVVFCILTKSNALAQLKSKFTFDWIISFSDAIRNFSPTRGISHLFHKSIDGRSVINTCKIEAYQQF